MDNARELAYLQTIDTLTAELAKKSDLYAGVKTLCEQQIEQNQRLRDALEEFIDKPDYTNPEGIVYEIKRLLEGEGE